MDAGLDAALAFVDRERQVYQAHSTGHSPFGDIMRDVGPAALRALAEIAQMPWPNSESPYALRARAVLDRLVQAYRERTQDAKS